MRNVQYGCGLSCPTDWENYDTSPTLRLQKIPIFGKLITRNRVTFPDGVRIGDITKRLPIEDNSVDNLYCSHVLEHLSFQDFHHALKESYRVLKPNGVFRLVMPDLRPLVERYVKSEEADASVAFIRGTLMGVEERPKGFKNRAIQSAGNHHHLWLWDAPSTSEALKNANFKDIRLCQFGDAERAAFASVEEASRFNGAIAIQCTK